MALPIVLLMALALLAPGTAMAAEETSGYNQTPTTPTTSTPSTTPSTGTSPSKEEAPTSTTPSKETEPTKSTSPAKEAKTLPFTGFDLRWSFGIGLVLMGAGFSIVMMQRRRREGGR